MGTREWSSCSGLPGYRSLENDEHPDEACFFWLNSGRVVEHLHTRTGKLGNLNKFSPTPCMEMNPDAGHVLGIRHGSYARPISRRGDAVVMAQFTHRVPREMVFVPLHFDECVNRVSLGLLDPYSRQPAYKQCAVRVEQVEDQNAAGVRNRAARSY